MVTAKVTCTSQKSIIKTFNDKTNIMKEILIAIHETVAPAAQPFYASTLTAVALFLLWTIIIKLAANSTIK